MAEKDVEGSVAGMGRGKRKRHEGRKKKSAATLQPALLHALMKLRLPLALHQTLVSLLSSVLSFMDHYRYLKIHVLIIRLFSPPLCLLTSALSNLKPTEF